MSKAAFTLMTGETLSKNIVSVGRRVETLRGEIQKLAVHAVGHVEKHGDPIYCTKLHAVLGKSVRRQSLLAWFEQNAPVTWKKEKEAFVLDADRRKEFKFDAEKLLTIAWEAAQPEPVAVSTLDVQDLVDKFVKRVEGAMKKDPTSVKHGDLYDVIRDAVAKYTARQVLGEAADNAVTQETKGETEPAKS